MHTQRKAGFPMAVLHRLKGFPQASCLISFAYYSNSPSLLGQRDAPKKALCPFLKLCTPSSSSCLAWDSLANCLLAVSSSSCLLAKSSQSRAVFCQESPSQLHTASRNNVVPLVVLAWLGCSAASPCGRRAGSWPGPGRPAVHALRGWEVADVLAKGFRAGA